ncbi:hypothetical protein ISF_07201 [Cordyceps fumosorosea ARSEF 2679]|uniref:DUF7719 domain-containing protein n=1 Tax=Cordyceps fumosorosea (strain ARSEF 2679) TaxID=1081104 RepID=A0A167Q4I9_CORFA|nr:hypothetical protein ISF_07201 [Cordyceps fumosorosea ARSEF 2679]OAA57280.1 hypothetical protein ISF_07201 [Cordyceps fumosorosea ARSEF 2679]
MTRSRKTRTTASHAPPPLAHPDRSGPAIDDQTLFKIAEQRQLFQQAAAREKKSTASARKLRVSTGGSDGVSSDGSDSDDEFESELPTLSPGAERVLEAMLWTTSLAMLHFTFDVLVQHQYGTEIVWGALLRRTCSAWAVFLLLFYALHPRKSDQTLVPGLPAHWQAPLRQAVFFAMSVAAGCGLLYVTNRKGYLATQRRAPPLGCLWIWAVVELELPWATLSLLVASAYVYLQGYKIR